MKREAQHKEGKERMESAVAISVRVYSPTSSYFAYRFLFGMPPKPCKTQPVAPPNPSKSRSGAPRGVKIHPGNDPDQPRDAQERPRSGQEAPKKRPRRAKRRPRAPKSRPRSAPDPSKSEAGEPRDKFLACFFGEVLRERLLKRFCIVF